MGHLSSSADLPGEAGDFNVLCTPLIPTSVLVDVCLIIN